MDARLGSSVGLRTLNRCVRQLARLVHPWQQQPVDAVPPVVRVDGIWVTLMAPTEEVKVDRLGRQRAAIWFFRYLAACDQHGHDDRDVPDGVSDPKFTEPRQRRNPG